MTKFLSGTSQEWTSHLYTQLLRYRHYIFVEKLGWDIPRKDGMEFDQFDRDDTVHVVAHDSAGEVSAYSRLLPTVKPYLLAEVFPQLMDGQCLPCSEDTWELSRFTARDSDDSDTGSVSRNFVFSPMAKKLLHQTISVAAGQGAKNLIFVGSPGMATLMARADLDVHRIGRPQRIGGHNLLAAIIRI